jgi:nucleotide-binding universal stress UspA family protein
MYAKILVPLDGSERAEGILPYVEELARPMESTIVFLQVVEPVYEVIAPEGAVVAMESGLLESRLEGANAYVNRLTGEFTTRGLDANGFVETGPVVNTIINVAERENVNLIAMVSHGRTGLARVFYGSVAAGILHQIDRPLLLIRSDG